MPAKKTAKKKWETYQDYLNSEEWGKLRKQAIEKADNRCEQCGNTSLKMQVHHWRYPEDWTKDKIDNVVALCWECHEKRHLEKRAISRDHYLELIQAEVESNLVAID